MRTFSLIVAFVCLALTAYYTALAVQSPAASDARSFSAIFGCIAAGIGGLWFSVAIGRIIEELKKK